MLYQAKGLSGFAGRRRQFHFSTQTVDMVQTSLPIHYVLSDRFEKS
jgi:hypothetical protein